MLRVFHIACLIALAGCGEWPDLPESTVRTNDWPTLQPLDDVLPAEAPNGDAIVDEVTARSSSLSTRAATLGRGSPETQRVEALNARAEILRQPVEDGDAFEELRARIGG